MAHGITAENEYHSRVCLVIFPISDDPFDILVMVHGSGEHAIPYPSVVIPVYSLSESDSISVVAYYFKFPDFPLQPMR